MCFPFFSYSLSSKLAIAYGADECTVEGAGISTDVGISLTAAGVGIVRSLATRATSVAYLTDAERGAKIGQSGVVGGDYGVFALETSKAPQTTLRKSAATTILFKELSVSVEITGGAAQAFRPAPMIGPVSIYRNLAGQMSTTLGVAETSTQTVKAGQIVANGVVRTATVGEKFAALRHTAVRSFSRHRHPCGKNLQRGRPYKRLPVTL
ncbi:MAG: hypothetical protein LBV12_03040 [Puniceicoccales bacterium]|jgi:hypothetical protein|nr:hypothetical protein [Puniceicoccales bacterium]